MVCSLTHESYLKPVTDSKTRWNSTFEMLSVCFSMKKSINDFIEKQGKNTTFTEINEDSFNDEHEENQRALPLTRYQWELVGLIITILEPINNATHAMCADFHPTLTLMMPFFDSIMDSLERLHLKYREEGLLNEDMDDLAEGTEAALQKLLKYFEVSSDLAILATIMDPRIKMDYYRNNTDSNYLAIVQNIVSEIAVELKLDSQVTIFFKFHSMVLKEEPSHRHRSIYRRMC